MDFREYACSIGFNTVSPMDPQQNLEISNTDIPEKMVVGGLSDLCIMPRMSTFAIGSLINKAVREMPSDQFYVNVGVWHGFSLLAGMVSNPDKYCIGIDNFSEFGGPRMEFRKRYLDARSENHHFFEMDYKQYFNAMHKPVNKIGFYFYDGAHDYQNQLDGLNIAEPFLADNAIVMVDDWNWDAPRDATKEFFNQSKNEWETIIEQLTSGNGHPTFWNGIAVFRKGGLK